jgi:RNA polymerase sigma-70 factor (ECF subfamily)
MTPDESLLSRLKGPAGPERDAAIAELRDKLIRGLSNPLNNRYGQPADIEDIVQESLVKILGALDRFEGRSRFLTWAMTIAMRVGISAVRRKHHRTLSLDAFNDADGGRIELALDDSPGVVPTQQRRELLGLLERLIDERLTEKQRIATRAMLAGYSTDGIAERMGTNRNAVYKLVHDARARLKGAFEERGVSADDIRSILS